MHAPCAVNRRAKRYTESSMGLGVVIELGAVAFGGTLACGLPPLEQRRAHCWASAAHAIGVHRAAESMLAPARCRTYGSGR